METAVQTKGLAKVYEGKIRALDGIDLTVETGIAFALLGPNGAGKTTLMRILTTQIRPTSGEAHVLGLDATRDGGRIRRLVSYVPQEMSVWTDVTGYENLLVYGKIYGIPSAERRKIIEEALGRMGLSEVANNLVKTYSGGMIRRLEVACAMLIKPKIMFLDEPTIGLDPSARKVVWEVLTSFKKEYGATLFFNTHYMDEADLYADKIAIINEGKIVKLGTAEELKRSVGGEVILFNIEGSSNQEGCFDRIRKLDMVNDVITGSSELSVVVNDAETVLPNIMECLRVNGVSVKKISITKPTLDDVFLKYAGTRLESVGRISEVRQVRGMIRRG
jgi:ABC-2 type transport system ATP-binding protein